MSLDWVAVTRTPRRYVLPGSVLAAELPAKVSCVPFLVGSEGTAALVIFPEGVGDSISVASPSVECKLIAWQSKRPVDRTSQVLFSEVALETLTSQLIAVPPTGRMDSDTMMFDPRSGWPDPIDLVTHFNSEPIQEWLNTLDTSVTGYQMPEPIPVLDVDDGAQTDVEGMMTGQEELSASQVQLARAREAALAYGEMDAVSQQTIARAVSTGAPGLQPRSVAAPKLQARDPSSLPSPILAELRKQTELITNMNLRIKQLEAAGGGQAGTPTSMPRNPMGQAGMMGMGMGWEQNPHAIGAGPAPGHLHAGLGAATGLPGAGMGKGNWDPMQMATEGLDPGQSTLARGSAAIQEVVFQLENHPVGLITAFEKQVARDCGALHPWQPWSTSILVDKHLERMTGHVTMKKMLRVLSHIYELHRRYPNHPEFSRAFTAQAIKVTLDASRAGGSWDLSWPLLGLVDPEEQDGQALSPSERVAVAALAKEKKIIGEIAAAAKNNRKQGKGKDGKEDS